MNFHFTFLLMITCGFVFTQPFNVSNSDLKMIITLLRHGARVSRSDSINLLDKKANSGELSVVGQRQLYYLGSLLNKDYIQETPLLSQKYNPSEIYVRSTDFNRTIMSAQSLLAGLYPAKSGDKIPQDILENNKELLNVNFKLQGSDQIDQIDDTYPILNGFQSIPIHVVERHRDKILLGFGFTCPNEKAWNLENQKSEDWQRITQEFIPSIQKFARIFNLDITSLDLYTLYNYMDIIIAQKYENKQLPQQYVDDKELQKNMETLYNLRIHLSLYKTPLQKRVTVTPFLNNLVQVLNHKIVNPINKLKGYFLSAHDTTINMVLQGLNLTSWECIEQSYMKNLPEETICNTALTAFGSNLIVELRKDRSSQEHFIMVRYHGQYQKICDQKSNYCNFEEFKTRVENFVVSDYDLACGINQPSENK